jgi:hypothetical protein
VQLPLEGEISILVKYDFLVSQLAEIKTFKHGCQY